MNDDAPEVVQHMLNELLTLYSKSYTDKKAEVTEEVVAAEGTPVAPEKKSEEKKTEVKKAPKATEAPAKAKKSE